MVFWWLASWNFIARKALLCSWTRTGPTHAATALEHSLYQGCVTVKLPTGPRNAPDISFPLNLRTALSGAKFPFKMNKIICWCPMMLYSENTSISWFVHFMRCNPQCTAHFTSLRLEIFFHWKNETQCTCVCIFTYKPVWTMWIKAFLYVPHDWSLLLFPRWMIIL